MASWNQEPIWNSHIPPCHHHHPHLQLLLDKSEVAGWITLVLFTSQETSSSPKPFFHTPVLPPCEAVDMEAEMERLESDTHNPVVVQEGSHYATPARQLLEVIKNVNDSAVNRARVAYYNDSLYQRDEER